jgi:plastocyanin
VWADEEVLMVEGSATDITSWAFSPLEVSVPAGQLVTFRTMGGQAHSATAGSGAFDTGLLPPGESKTLALAAPGAYPFV